MKYVSKGWGYELWIANSKDYCGKLLYFVKGKKCSFHYHKLKKETFFVDSGKILLYYSWQDDLVKADQIILEEGDSFDVPIGLRHQMLALKTTKLYEFSTEHFDDDSIRIIKGD